MSIATQLRERLAGATRYECGFCGQAYDQERNHCLACGMDTVSPRGE